MEERIVDPKTGGAKGQKLARFDLIPPDPMWQLAEVYGLGAKKYADDNWLKGYRWRLSIGALLRHVFKFIGGEYLDAESGKPHLAHAMFHCIALMEFHRLGRGTDDRQCSTAETTYMEFLHEHVAGPNVTSGAGEILGAQDQLPTQSVTVDGNSEKLPASPKKRVYIAGPMRGISYYNFPAFDAAAARLSARGMQPVNPADLDRATGFSPFRLPATHDWRNAPPGFDMRSCRERDIKALESCDAIYMLRGWGSSKGATAEHAHAVWMGIDVIEECAFRRGCMECPLRAGCVDA